MISRRTLIVSAGLGAAGLAGLALGPDRRTRPQIPNLDRLVPASLGPWTAVPADEVVLPPDDLLANQIYDQVVVRGYRNERSAVAYLVIAYGAAQSYSMQLHRPEYCYPASGYTVTTPAPVRVKVGDERISADFLRATRAQREDVVLYWTRIGNAFPQGIWQQRLAIAGAAFRRGPPDGVLVRLSKHAELPGGDLAALAGLADALFHALPDNAREALFGRRSTTGAEA